MLNLFFSIDLTQTNGKLLHVPWHGLQKYQTLSTRVAAKLTYAKNGAELIFIGTSGLPRDDGGTNSHKMFMAFPSGLPPYFKGTYFPSFYQAEGCCINSLKMKIVDVLTRLSQSGFKNFGDRGCAAKNTRQIVLSSLT